MIVKGQRFDLVNRRQIIDLEVAKRDQIPEGALQVLTIPIGDNGLVLPSWPIGGEVAGVTITDKPRSIRIAADTSSIAADVIAVTVVVHTDKAGVMRAKLSKAGNIFVRVNTEMFDLTEHATGRGLVAFSIYRRNGAWRFNAIGEPYEWGLEEIYPFFGIDESLAPHVRTKT